MADTPSLGIPSGGMKNASEMGGGKESLNSLKSGCISITQEARRSLYGH